MVARAEKEAPAHEFIPLGEFSGLISTIRLVNEVAQPRFKSRRLEAPPLFPEDVKIVAKQGDFICLQREVLFPRSQLHKSARWFYRKLDQDYGGIFPLVSEPGCLIVPETKKLFLSPFLIDEANSLVDKTKDEKGQKSDFLLNIGSFLLREELRRVASCHISAESHLADLALKSFSSHILQTAKVIEKSWSKPASALRRRVNGLNDRFSRDLDKAREEGSLRIEIEGARMAVFIEDKLLLRAGFWLDRQMAEIASSRLRSAFAKKMFGEERLAEAYIDKFNAKRKYLGQEFDLTITEIIGYLGITDIKRGASLLDAYFKGKIPLVFA